MLVIVHGWSDHATSFVPLQSELANRLGVKVTPINLAEWLSMDDLVTYDDLVTRFDGAWNQNNLPRTPWSVDVIVHSTGSLLVRAWLTKFFPDPLTAPIKHFVMLAPANFGSPIAHKGTSFIGRVVKGWDSPKMFEVGEILLKGLELASPYTWNLADLDLFGSVSYYGPNKILATVLAGNAGYTGISSAANEPGSDGTVRVSTANLNALYVSADLTDPANPKFDPPEASKGEVGFRVMDGLNHGTIHDPTQPGVTDAIVTALTVEDSGFQAYCDRLSDDTRVVLSNREAASDAYYWGYQNTVILVKDQYGTHVDDYFIEFYGDGVDTFWEELFHTQVIEDVHAFGDDPGYRSLLIDTKTLRNAGAKAPGGALRVSLTATPDISKSEVGYSTFGDADIGGLTLTPNDLTSLFQPNRTVFIEITIKRQQRDEIVQFGVQPPNPVS